MEASRIESILDRAEAAVAAGDPVGPTGFWKAVAEVKARPELVEAYADRIARIDRAAFKEWAVVVVPLWLGNVVMVGATLVGLVLVGLSYRLTGLVAVVVFYLGFGAVLTASHGLGHQVVGRLSGMRFSHWFIGSWRQPQPGVKVDYSTYLHTAARSRAWMHASGAIVTKVVPFLLLGAALAADLPGWSVWLLGVIAVAMVITDLLWSTKASDWMKYRREMSYTGSS